MLMFLDCVFESTLSWCFRFISGSKGTQAGQDSVHLHSAFSARLDALCNCGTGWAVLGSPTHQPLLLHYPRFSRQNQLCLQPFRIFSPSSLKVRVSVNTFVFFFYINSNDYPILSFPDLVKFTLVWLVQDNSRPGEHTHLYKIKRHANKTFQLSETKFSGSNAEPCQLWAVLGLLQMVVW